MGLFETLRSTLTHPLVAGPLGGGFVILMAYLDARYRDVEREQSTYFKLFMVSSLVFATIIYFVSAEHNQTDEFLNQSYDTSAQSLMPKKKSLSGGKTQPLMKRPDPSISLMDNLPEPGTYSTPEYGGSKVSMKIKPLKRSRRSKTT